MLFENARRNIFENLRSHHSQSLIEIYLVNQEKLLTHLHKLMSNEILIKMRGNPDDYRRQVFLSYW